MMGQSIWLLQKKKSCEHIHELINMNPTIYIIGNNVGLFSQYLQNKIQTSLIFVQNFQKELFFMQVKLGNPLVCLYVTLSVYGVDIPIE